LTTSVVMVANTTISRACVVDAKASACGACCRRRLKDTEAVLLQWSSRVLDGPIPAHRASHFGPCPLHREAPFSLMSGAVEEEEAGCVRSETYRRGVRSSPWSSSVHSGGGAHRGPVVRTAVRFSLVSARGPWR